MINDFLAVSLYDLKSGEIVLYNTGTYWSCGIYLGINSCAKSLIDLYFSDDENYYRYIITKDEEDLNDLYYKLLRETIIVDLTILPLRKELCLTDIERKYIQDLAQEVLQDGIKKVYTLNTVVCKLYTVKDLSVREEDFNLCVIKSRLSNNCIYAYIENIKELIQEKIKDYEKRKEQDVKEIWNKLKSLKPSELVLNKPLFIIEYDKVLPVEIVKITRDEITVKYFYFWFRNEPLEWFIYKSVKERGNLHYIEQTMQRQEVKIYECEDFRC